VLELQRRRMLDAMAHVLAERGLRSATIGEVASRAGVSRATFCELFEGLEDCFVALLEHVMVRSTTLIREAFAREASWQDAVCAGLEALLVFLDSEPALARMILVEALAGPIAALQRRARLLEPLKPLVEGGRERLPAHAQPPPVTAEATIIAVAGILHARLVDGQAPPYIDLLGELNGLVVAPYLGVSAAAQAIERGDARARVLAREVNARRSKVHVVVPDELRHAKAYRLRSCLLYLAANPGLSNQAVASGIGVSHLGQTSVLLSRLNSLGLLTKRSGGAGRPNAWCPSPYGEQVAQAIDYR
jgi:AcrR family transcriptional regulator